MTSQVTSKLKSLPQTVPQMLQEVLSRLETDLGQEVVSLAMSLLVCSRDGKIPISVLKTTIRSVFPDIYLETCQRKLNTGTQLL